MPRYQPRYCEENVWHVLDDTLADAPRAWAVFVSNSERRCAMWSQRASDDPDTPVVWDYHVVALERNDAGHRIWDLDSTVGAPVEAGEWWRATFPFDDRLPEEFRPRFRVVDRPDFLATFSSDRSHMKDEDGDWLAPPPAWEPIFSEARGMNLDRFVDMTGASDDVPGELMGPSAFVERFTGRPE